MPPDPHLQAILDRLLSGLRGQLEGALRSYGDESAHRQTEELRRSGETQIAELRTMLEDIRARARQHQQALDARLDEALRERDEALSRAHQNASGVYARATRLSGDARAMDDADSLSAVLERLLAAAAHRADRSALVVMDAGGMRVWRTDGLSPPAEDNSTLTPDGAGMIGAAARLARVVTTREDAAPAFAVPPPRDGAAFPIAVGGEIVAVLYVDLTRSSDDRRAEWPELDLLARHAGAALESLTFRHAVGLRPVAVARPSQTSSGSGASASHAGDGAGTRPFGGLQ